MKNCFIKALFVVICVLSVGICNVHASDMDDLLFSGVRNGDIDLIKTALNGGADINQTQGNLTPLGQAIEARRMGAYPVIKFLIEKGADVNKTYICSMPVDRRHSVTPLIGVLNIGMGILDRSHIAIASLLIKAGADVNAADEYGDLPLIIALSQVPTNPEVINLVVEMMQKKVDVNNQGIRGYTPLMAIAECYKDPFLPGTKYKVALANMFLAAGADPAIRNENGKTALSIAIARGNKEIINLLMPLTPKDE